MKDETPEPTWVVYDGRATTGDTFDAAVLESFGWPDCKTDEQAIRSAQRMWKGHEYALYRYDVFGKGKNRKGENERLIHVGTI